MKKLTPIALALLAFQNLSLGLWATLFPRQWYDSFPGLGRVWVAIDGPYNEHLVRDVGAAALGLGLIAVAAFVRREALLVAVAGAANLVFALPHLAYHVRHTAVYTSSSDKFASVGGLGLTSLAAAIALWAGYADGSKSVVGIGTLRRGWRDRNGRSGAGGRAVR